MLSSTSVGGGKLQCPADGERTRAANSASRSCNSLAASSFLLANSAPAVRRGGCERVVISIYYDGVVGTDE